MIGINMVKAVDVLDISASVLRSCMKCFSGFVDDEGGLVDLKAFVATSSRRCEVRKIGHFSVCQKCQQNFVCEQHLLLITFVNVCRNRIFFCG